jgi:hypothetical protein
MSKHTPGPWHTGDINEHGAITIYSDESNYVASAYLARWSSAWTPEETLHSPDNVEAVANAHLIAAAPDLLAACEAYIEWRADMEVIQERMRAAIAKARGEA